MRRTGFAWAALLLCLAGGDIAWAGDRAIGLTIDPDESGYVRLEGDFILVQGRIRFVSEKRFAAALETLLEQGRQGSVEIRLDSEGGNLDATFDMLRSMESARNSGLRFQTRVPPRAICYSACTLLFAAGDERIAGGDASFLFHGITHRGPTGQRDGRGRARLIAEAGEKYIAAIGEADPGLARYLREQRIVARNLEVTFEAAELRRIFPAFVTRIEDPPP